MLSLVFHAGYEASDFAENIHYPRYFQIIARCHSDGIVERNSIALEKSTSLLPRSLLGKIAIFYEKIIIMISYIFY